MFRLWRCNFVNPKRVMGGLTCSKRAARSASAGTRQHRYRRCVGANVKNPKDNRQSLPEGKCHLGSVSGGGCFWSSSLIAGTDLNSLKSVFTGDSVLFPMDILGTSCFLQSKRHLYWCYYLTWRRGRGHRLRGAWHHDWPLNSLVEMCHSHTLALL